MYPSPGYVISTPMILATVFTSRAVTSVIKPPLSSLNPSSSNSSGTKFSIKLPKITSPAAPSPSPPYISTLGGPHSSTFPVLHSLDSLSSTSEPNNPKAPTSFSKSVMPSCTF